MTDRQGPGRRWPRSVLILIGLAVLLVPAVSLLLRPLIGVHAKVGALNEQAELELRLGRSKAAVAKLDEALQLDPDSVGTLRNLARALMRAGDRDRARDILERVCAVDQLGILPRMQLAELAMQDRDAETARRYMQWLNHPARNARTRPYRELVSLLNHRLALIEGDLTAAALAAEQVLDVNPRSVAGLVARGNVALARGNPAKARKLISTATEAAPVNAQLAILLSRACEEMGDLGAARAALEAAELAEDPEGRLAVRRAEVAAAAGSASELARIARELPDTGSSAARDYIEGLQALTLGEVAAAAEAFRRAVSANSRLSSARLQLAKTLVRLQDLDGARDELRSLLADEPLNRSVRLQLGRIALLAGDPEEAVPLAEDLLRMVPRDLDAVALLVDARSKQGKAPEAARFLQELQEQDPANSVAAFGQNLAWLAAAELDAAVQGGERLLADNPTARGALEVLAAAYAARRGIADALDRLRVFVSADPRFAPLRLELAHVYVSVNRFDEAEVELRAALRDAPELTAAYLGLARIAERRDDIPAAIEHVNRYLEIHAQDVEARAMLARLLLRGAHYEAALEVVDRPVGASEALDRDNRSHLVTLARVGFAARIEMGDIDQAIVHFDTARAVSPDISRSIVAAAFAVYGRDSDAAARIGAVLADPSPGAEARWVAAIVALQRGDPDAAVRHGRLSAITERIDHRVVLVHALLSLGDRSGAMRTAGASETEGARHGQVQTPLPLPMALESYVASLPIDRVESIATPLHRLQLAAAYGFRNATLKIAQELRRDAADLVLVPLLCAQALEQSGFADEARTTLEDALRRHPRALPIIETLSAKLVELEEYRAAASLLERAIELAPGQARLRVFAGLAREGLGKEKQAIDAYRAAVQLDPNSAIARNNLAWLLLQRGEAVDEAYEQAERARELAPSSGRVLDTYGLAQLMHDRLAEALATLTEARSLSPSEPTVRYHLGLCYRRLGQPKRALAELDIAVMLGPDTQAGRSAARLREQVAEEFSGGRGAGDSFETAGLLGQGEAASDTLGLRGALHVYRVVLEEPGFLLLRVQGPHDAGVELRLRRNEDEGLRLLKRTSLPPGDELLWRLSLDPGAYSVELVATDRPSVADYRISLAEDTGPRPSADIEPNDTVVDAEALTLGVTVMGWLGPQLDRDVFALPDVAGAPLDLRLSAPEVAGLSFRLLDPQAPNAPPLKAGQLLAGTSARIPALLPGPNGIVMEISSSRVGGGEYELSAHPSAELTDRPDRLSEPDDGFGAAHVLPAYRAGVEHTTRSGTILPAGDRDIVRLPSGRFAFEVRAPADIGLRASLLLVDAALARQPIRTLRVAPGGTAKIASLEGDSLVLVLDATDPSYQSGSPYRIVWGRPGATGDLEPNDGFSSASPLEEGELTGVLDGPTDRDVFRLGKDHAVAYALAVEADRPLTVTLLATLPHGGVGSVRRISVEPGHPLDLAQWVPGSEDAALELTPFDRGGPYRIRLTALEGRRRELEAEPNERAVHANLLVPGLAVSGRLDGPADRDLFAIDAREGGETVAFIVETTSGAPPRVTVFDGEPDLGDRRLAPEPEPRQQLQLRVMGRRRIYIVIESAANGETGSGVSTTYRVEASP